MKWPIDFFENDRGASPPRAFLLALPTKAQAKLLRALELLEDYGPTMGEPYVKAIRGKSGLMELRTSLGSDAFRLFFFHAGGRRLVVVHGIRKKSKRTPLRDLDTAERRMLEHTRRLG
jgi:phage-related protein